MSSKNFFQKNTHKPKIHIEQKAGLPSNIDEGVFFFHDDKAKYLTTLIGNAIDEWAAHYHMEDLPKHILFEQALAIMNSINRIINKSR